MLHPIFGTNFLSSFVSPIFQINNIHHEVKSGSIFNIKHKTIITEQFELINDVKWSG